MKIAEMFTLQVVTVLLILCQLARPATSAKDEGFVLGISNIARLLGVELPCMGERAVELVPVSELKRVWTMALVGAPADELHGGCTP